MNIRTYHKLLVLVIALMVLAVRTQPPVSVVSFILLFAICLYGAFNGILFSLGRLYFGCPLCTARSKVMKQTRGKSPWTARNEAE